MKHKDDRITGLPEAIVEHILSFIPLKRILQLSILSKRWQNVIWTLFPIPEFVSTPRRPILYENSSNEKRQEIRVCKEEFNYFLERTLASRNKQRVSINKLKVQIRGSLDYALMNRLTGYVIESNVKELDLDLQLSYYICYQVPKSFVAAKSITELMLHPCESYLQVHVDEQILQTLIASCPVVQEMSFDCYGLSRIHMSGFPKLIAVGLHYKTTFESFEMEAPNLKKLELMHLPNLTDEWLHGILSKYPLIESLDLHYCEMLKMIKISSDHMKHLTIFQCNSLVEVDIVAPNLHKLEYYGDVISISSKTLTLSEVSIFLNNGPPLDAEKIEFLAKLNHPKLLTWIAQSAEDVITPKELRETLRSPLYNVKQLKLEIHHHRSEIYEINEFMDALLWIFPLLETLFIEWMDPEESEDEYGYLFSSNISFKFSYENHVRKGENPSCCKFLPVSCWRHCLKTVKIEDQYIASALMKDLEEYFFNNAEILRSNQYSERPA